MIFARGLSVPEGPVVLPDGSWLCVEMGADRGCVTHISPDGKGRRALARTGRPNGLAVDREGAIWVAESRPAGLLRMQMDGSYQVFLDGCEGEPFLFPNDLAFGPDGTLYMTDSGIPINDFAPGEVIRADYASLMPDGRVYSIDIASGKIRKHDHGIRFTNGIAVGPDGYLYVNETFTGNVYRYRMLENDLGARELFGNVVNPDLPPGFRGPDGMKFGKDGNLYVTVFGQGDVTVLGKDGQVLKRIPMAGKRPSNLAFGLPGDTRIYVTEDELGHLEAHDVGVEGLPLYY
ncbi:MAG TPA: SMP-30/gluconolactonase/LRE family protein [Anaerolinea sp.]|nr:SMP-30/gluconolactonase/LRE family protein [Anaerolinea sp.]